MAGFEFEFDALDLQREMEETQDEILKEMQIAMQDELAAMKLRTQSGKNVQGRSMGRYSKAYKEIRQKAGRQTKVVDLLFTGQMLANIQIRARRIGNSVQGLMFFGSAKDAAKAVDIERKPNREFFALSDEQVERIRNRVVQAINKL